MANLDTSYIARMGLKERYEKLFYAAAGSRRENLLERIDKADEKQLEELKGIVGNDGAKFVYSMLGQFSEYFNKAPFPLRETNVEKVFGFAEESVYDDLESTLDEDVKWQNASAVAKLPWVGQKYLDGYGKKRKELIKGLKRRNRAISIRRMDMECRKMEMKILLNPKATDSEIEAAMHLLSARAALMEDGP